MSRSRRRKWRSSCCRKTGLIQRSIPLWFQRLKLKRHLCPRRGGTENWYTEIFLMDKMPALWQGFHGLITLLTLGALGYYGNAAINSLIVQHTLPQTLDHNVTASTNKKQPSIVSTDTKYHWFFLYPQLVYHQFLFSRPLFPFLSVLLKIWATKARRRHEEERRRSVQLAFNRVRHPCLKAIILKQQLKELSSVQSSTALCMTTCSSVQIEVISSGNVYLWTWSEQLVGHSADSEGQALWLLV